MDITEVYLITNTNGANCTEKLIGYIDTSVDVVAANMIEDYYIQSINDFTVFNMIAVQFTHALALKTHPKHIPVSGVVDIYTFLRHDRDYKILQNVEIDAMYEKSYSSILKSAIDESDFFADVVEAAEYSIRSLVAKQAAKHRLGNYHHIDTIKEIMEKSTFSDSQIKTLLYNYKVLSEWHSIL